MRMPVYRRRSRQRGHTPGCARLPPDRFFRLFAIGRRVPSKTIVRGRAPRRNYRVRARCVGQFLGQPNRRRLSFLSFTLTTSSGGYGRRYTRVRARPDTFVVSPLGRDRVITASKR